ncbi:MAG: TlpA family protein disulfide reductase [Gemmatimonadales bacterium]|jgi:thiol-disulfide isomerase/thioredoxin|nr:TlpA family protein disulfide reductase [Gemmatimonadales bacterium]
MRRALAGWTVTLALGFAAVPASAQQGLAVGSRAPAVVIADLEGRAVDLGALVGRKPFLVEFWATWCSVCEELLPKVRAAHAAHGDRVEFFGVNVTVNQTRDRVRRYLERHQPPYRTLYDEKGVGARAFDVPITSYIVIVDAQGKVAYTGSGADQDLEAAVRKVAAR